MLSTNFVLVTALAYVVLLFVLAFVSDRRARGGRGRLLRSPLVYTLSISVYCTSWTLFGAVGSAARSGLEFATIYLGPTLVFVGWWFLLRKLVRIGHVHRITSIADLISSRFGKSTTLGVLVTCIAVIASTPYIALQLKAVTASFGVLGSAARGGTPSESIIGGTEPGLWVAIAMTVFTILFGTRNLDANEHNPGVVAAIAFEAVVKLAAILAVGLFVVFGIAGGIGNVFQLAPANEIVYDNELFGWRWINLMVLSGIAIVCLPRQFQITVVENSDENHLRTASWAFPLYLFVISLFVLPIAIVGSAALPAGSNPDMFLLTLPLSEGRDMLALFAFIGGFSSATSMVIVASIALSIMASNHIVVPLVLRMPGLKLEASGDIKQLMLITRRIFIGVILLLGYLYFRLSAESDALATMGLIAFVGVAQFFPALVGSLYWRNATTKGTIAGLAAGFGLWIYTSFIPSLSESGGALAHMVEYGPWGIELLKPQALFGLSGLDPLIHSVFWSLAINTALFVSVSVWTTQGPLEKLQSALFVDVFRNIAGTEARVLHRRAAIKDLYKLTQRVLGPAETHKLFHELTGGELISERLPPLDAEDISRIERRLAGNMGASTAHALVSQIATGETISMDEIIKLVDETQQVVEYSHRLEQQSAQLQATADQLRSANERLQQLDAQKDEFLSQVSHEVRTPMTSIRSFAELLLGAENLTRQQSQRFVRIIHEESLRMTRLLDEILEMNRLEHGGLQIDSIRLQPDAVVDRALDTCRGLAEQNGVALDSGRRARTAEVMGDPERLYQVLINLLTNAVQYNNSAQPLVQVDSRIVVDSYELDVSDNGPGIADVEQIFEKFSRGRQTSGKHGGTGLGLAISRRLVQEMGGELVIVESHGQGTRFRIRMPLAPEERQSGLGGRSTGPSE
ncbi:MAG: sodium:solute symporter [Gammaproteobacteria bacterium]|nr:sodium:solute symporter [Gammaproteobacteria bacterium]